MARIGKTAEDIRESAERARGADAVRVTVRRDGLARSAEVEVLGPETEGWVPCLAAAVRLDGDAETGRAGAVLTFASGERVEIGAPAPAPAPAPAASEHTLGMLEGERQIEALEASWGAP